MRVHEDADDTAGEACDEVDDQVACSAEGEFDERADLVQDVHVEADVDDAEVEEGRGEETPVLMGSESVRGVVAAPTEDIEWGWFGEGQAARHHGEKDEGVGRDEGVGNGVTVGLGRDCDAGGRRGPGLGYGHVVTVLALRGCAMKQTGEARVVTANGEDV